MVVAKTSRSAGASSNSTKKFPDGPCAAATFKSSPAERDCVDEGYHLSKHSDLPQSFLTVKDLQLTSHLRPSDMASVLAVGVGVAAAAFFVHLHHPNASQGLY